MSAVTKVSTPLQAAMGALSAKVDSSPSSASLLPDPYLSAPLLDDVAVLYMLQAKDAQLGLSQGKQHVNLLASHRDTLRTQALNAELKAIADAKEAESHHSFWDSIGDVLGTVAKVAGVVASIALAVVSCGAATPIAALAIAGAVLSTASLADSELHILEKLGVDPKVAGWIDFGLSVGSAVCGGVAGVANGNWLTTTTTLLAKSGEVGAHVARAVDSIEQAHFQGKEEDELADALAAQREDARLGRKLIAYIEELKDNQSEAHRIMKTTQGVIQTMDASELAAVR